MSAIKVLCCTVLLSMIEVNIALPAATLYHIVMCYKASLTRCFDCTDRTEILVHDTFVRTCMRKLIL